MGIGKRNQARVNKRLSYLPKTKKYYSILSKLKIIDEARNTSNHQAAFNNTIQPSNIRPWKKHEAKWRALPLEVQRSLKFINTKTI